MFKRTALVFVLALAGCSEPATKLNNDPNNGSNNGGNNGTTGSNNGNNGSNNGGNNGTTGPTIIDPDNYDQTCEWDSDCALVYGGDICGCPDTCGDAISAGAVEQFQSDVDAVVCPDPEPVPCPAIACAPTQAVCASGSCDTIFTLEVRAEDYDQTCETPEDCVLIPTGPVCSECDCGRGAINVNSLSEYEELVQDIDCNPGPSVCDCAPIEDVDCVEGMCVGGSF